MTGIIEIFTFDLIGQAENSLSSFIYSVVLTLIAIVLGVIIFNDSEKTLVHTL